MKPKLNTVIFSKDRGCQLDLLLRSMSEFMEVGCDDRVSVIFRASSSEFHQAYGKVQRRFPGVKFLDEEVARGGFRSTLLSVADRGIPMSMFLVDDDVFKNPFSLSDDEVSRFFAEPDVLCLSLRLGSHINYCYPMGRYVEPPVLDLRGSWSWKGRDGDWGYPMSLDGHIFRSGELLPLLEERSYGNPNELEHALSCDPLGHPMMMCYPDSRIINLPVNRVQNTFANRSGDVDVADLNHKFLHQDLMIDFHPLRGIRNSAPHQEHELRFVRQ